MGTSLAVQWLWLYASNVGGVSSIPSKGTKILHEAQCSQKKKKKKEIKNQYIKLQKIEGGEDGRGWDAHHWLNGHEYEQTPGDSEGQRSLVWCSPWGCKELDMT